MEEKVGVRVSYICKLTKDNKELFKRIIISIYSGSIMVSKEIAMIVIVWIYEYFCSYHFIDTEVEVTLKSLHKKLNGNMTSIRSLVVILADSRNIFVHTPYMYNVNTSALLKNNTDENVKIFCSVFEEDASKFESMYKECMEKLGCYERKSTSLSDLRF